jgi:hypothetical protein
VNNLRKLLLDQGIDHGLLFYCEGAQASIDALNTWNMGDRGKEKTGNVSKFPLVVWTEHHDDLTTTTNFSTSAADLQVKPLIAQKAQLAPMIVATPVDATVDQAVNAGVDVQPVA